MNGKYRHEVGILAHRSMVKPVGNFVPVNDGILFIEINNLLVNANIIQIYAYTTDHSDEKYKNSTTTVPQKNLPKHERNIILHH